MGVRAVEKSREHAVASEEPPWLEGAIVGLLYVALAWISHKASHAAEDLVPWRPEIGMVVAVTLINASRFTPFVLAGAVAAVFVVHGEAGTCLSRVIAELVIVGGYMGSLTFLQRSRWRFDAGLRTLRDVLILVAFAIASTAMVASVAELLMHACGDVQGSGLGESIFRSAIGDLIGILIVSPVILISRRARSRIHLTPEAIAQGLAILAALLFAFTLDGIPHYRLFNVIFFPILWIAIRHGLEGTVYGLLISELGLLAFLTIYGAQPAGATTYQSLMLVLAFTGLAVGGVVTERRRLEQELRLRQESVAQIFRHGSAVELATAIAHEINQPLTAISNYAKLIQRNLTQEQGDRILALEASEKLSSQVDRSAAVIKNLRGLIRLGQSNMRPTRVAEMVKEALELVEPALRRDAIVTSVTIPKDLPLVLADRLQIEQVLLNILKNSIDALAERARNERGISVSAGSMDDGRVELTIRDTGPGFPDGFDFAKAGLRSSTKTDGLGIGLSLSRTIVEAHRGEFLIASDRTGAIIRLRLASTVQGGRHA